jgi:beta-galactosidase
MLLSGRLSAEAPIPDLAAGQFQRLDEGWQFYRGSLNGLEQVWELGTARAWEQVTLPHCWNAMDACDPDVSYYRGQGWYRTHIRIKNPFLAGRIILHFQGAGQATTVWAGSTLIGTHTGGYDEFAFDITEAVAAVPAKIRAAGVPVTVQCDNSPDHERIPSDLSDFCLYGGLYRHVNLVYLPSVALESVHILPALTSNGSATVSVSARLYNPGVKTTACRISVEVRDPAGHIVYRSGNTRATWTGFTVAAEFTLAAPKLWSPASPGLYHCNVSLSSVDGEMSVEDRFGIRRFEFPQGGPFLLNGNRLLLRGTQRHADHAGLAAAMPDDLVREEMRLIREMGANFIRLAHYQQDRLVLDLCDELGILVWEELPWCRAGVGDAAFRQNAHDMLTHMIEQHYNHASIVFWGLGNEDDWPGEYPSMDQAAIRAFMTELRDRAHQLDDSRLTSFRRCDFARDIPDVYSPSIWAGWYRGQYRQYEQSLCQQRERVTRFIHIEWGADSHAGRHAEDPEAGLNNIPGNDGTDERAHEALLSGGEPRASSEGDWSETYACNLYDWHLKTQEKLDWLSGSAHWIFKDFASPQRGDNCIPRVNQKGVVERDLSKKESYYVFQSYWAEKPMVHIYGHSWPVRWGKPGQPRFVHVYSNCAQAELFLNENSMGVRRRNSQDFPAAGLRWNVPFAPGRNRLRAVATRGSIRISDEIEFVYQTEPWGKPAGLHLWEKTSSNGRSGLPRITVEAQLFDANGVLCLNARPYIRFSLTGSGALIDNMGTTRASRKLQLANGRAQISLHAQGRCQLHAVIEGIPEAILSI